MRLMQAGSDGNRFLLFRKVQGSFQGCDIWGRVLGRGAQLCLLPSTLLLPGAGFSFRPFLCGPAKLALGVHSSLKGCRLCSARVAFSMGLAVAAGSGATVESGLGSGYW